MRRIQKTYEQLSIGNQIRTRIERKLLMGTAISLPESGTAADFSGQTGGTKFAGNLL